MRRLVLASKRRARSAISRSNAEHFEGRTAGVSIRTFQEPVVSDVLLRVVLRIELMFVEFCATVMPVKAG